MHAGDRAGRTAVHFEGQKISWGELGKRVEELSPYFVAELGVKEQKVVDLLLTNSIDFITTYLAVLSAGHIVLPLDPAYKKLELDAMIEQVPPAMVITEPRYTGQISRHKLPVRLLSELPKSTPMATEPLRLPAKEQIASLFFTSGTSGKPKAVPNTHANHIWNIKTCSKVWDWTGDDTLLLTMPLSHMHGLVMGLSGALYHGNTIYLHQQSFDPEKILTELASGKISMFKHAPLAYMKMLEHPGDFDLSKVRLCVSGGAPLPPAVWRDFKDRFGIEIIETYGSSETGRIAGNRLGERLTGSPGRPLPGVDLKLSQDSEVLIKSGGVFPGYWHNPEATRSATTADGYWRTGDIAELKDGFVILKGRIQEKIRRFSYSISPRDVEWAMFKHPKIKDISVMGLQKPGEPNDSLVYFIATDLSEKEIREYCQDNLLFAWRPDKIIKVDELPRTRSGKVKIGELRSRLEEQYA